MKDQLVEVAFIVELEPGEKLTLPAALVDLVGPGRWILMVRPCPAAPDLPRRCHEAFLSGYAPEDEGLYDDVAG